MFTLHPQLAADCFVVGDLPLCRVLLMNDAQYPWLILVPRSDAELRELCELSEEDRLQFSRESDLAAGILNTVFAPAACSPYSSFCRGPLLAEAGMGAVAGKSLCRFRSRRTSGGIETRLCR